jgi:hypothetical protein
MQTCKKNMFAGRVMDCDLLLRRKGRDCTQHIKKRNTVRPLFAPPLYIKLYSLEITYQTLSLKMIQDLINMT